jgi:hypothetical protein
MKAMSATLLSGPAALALAGGHVTLSTDVVHYTINQHITSNI